MLIVVVFKAMSILSIADKNVHGAVKSVELNKHKANLSSFLKCAEFTELLQKMLELILM